MQSPRLLYVVSVNPDIRMLTCGLDCLMLACQIFHRLWYICNLPNLPPPASMHRLVISSTNRYTLNTYEIAIIISRRPINIVPGLSTTTTNFHPRLIHCRRLQIPPRTLYRLQPPPVCSTTISLVLSDSVWVHSP
jgi:hypothetical protein